MITGPNDTAKIEAAARELAFACQRHIGAKSELHESIRLRNKAMAAMAELLLVAPPSTAPRDFGVVAVDCDIPREGVTGDRPLNVGNDGFVMTDCDAVKTINESVAAAAARAAVVEIPPHIAELKAKIDAHVRAKIGLTDDGLCDHRNRPVFV